MSVDTLNPYAGLVGAAYVFYGLVYDTLQCVDEDLNIVNNLCVDSYVDPDYEPHVSAWTWELLPGMSVDDSWTASPLCFDLEYIGESEINAPWTGIAVGLGVAAAVAVAAIVLALKRKGRKGGAKEEEATPFGRLG